MHNLGDYEEVPEDLIATATRAGDAFALDAFDVAIDCAMSFPSGGTSVLSGHEGTRQLTVFHEELGEPMRSHDLRAGRSFTPAWHWCTTSISSRNIPIVLVRWVAREFLLIKGHVGKGTLDPLACWLLK